MDRYDIYDNQLNPGDIICWISVGDLHSGKIHSISMKGTLRVCFWNDQHQMFNSVPRNVSCNCYKIIKVTGIPKRKNYG